MNSIKKISKVFSALLLLSMGCSDDFLEKSDPNNSTPETFFTTLDALEQSVIGAYATQAIEAAFNRRAYWLGDFPADDVAVRDPSNTYESFSYGASDDSVFRVWRAFYMVISRANITLSNADGIETNNNAETVRKAKIVAEARFLRSLYHYYLTMWWGDVPYSTEEELENAFLPRTPRPEILNNIVADLNLAIPDLPSKENLPDEEMGRATKGAALTLLTRVLMVQQNWADAEVAATEVINGGYSLLSELRDIHDPTNSFNNESIYEIVFTNTGGGNFDWTTFTTTGNSAVNKSSFRSFWVYSPNRDGDGAIASEKLIAAYDDPNDPRLIDYYFGPTSELDGAPYDFAGRGWTFKKFLPIVGIDDRNNSDNFIMFRLADVILMRAEARAMQNDISGALDDLNAVRERAREGNPSLVPDITATSQNEVMEAIKNERFIELSAEVVRLIDIKRWEDWDELGSGFTPGQDELLPLPDSEVVNNSEITQNNPGY